MNNIYLIDYKTIVHYAKLNFCIETNVNKHLISLLNSEGCCKIRNYNPVHK